METSQLKIALSDLETFDDPSPHLEQYPTPPDVAADMLNLLELHIDGGQIIDMGSGTGILTIGAGLQGFTATGYEKDPDAIAIAQKNLHHTEDDYGPLDVTFVQANIEKISATADAVIMNPPFGIQQEDANLRFLETAFRTADDTFALLHRPEEGIDDTRQFIKEFASNRGNDARILRDYRFRLPPTMDFHSEDRRQVGVDLYHFNTR